MSWSITYADTPHFDSGDLVKYSRIQYFATDTDKVDSYSEEKIGIFLNFWDASTFDACQVYIFSEEKIITVSVRDLSLLSKNKKS